jgi:hypothetical protein
MSAENEKLVADAIDAAEEICDPLEGLAVRSAADKGAAFMPEALARLAVLKKGNRAAFEALRAQLKKAGCRVTGLDEAIAEESGDAGRRAPTQADILIDIAQTAELFHAADGMGFADLDISGHREIWRIRSKGFRRWLARCFFEETGGAPSSEALQSALNVIEVKAPFRCARAGWQALSRSRRREVAGRRDRHHRLVRHRQTERFRRASGMKPLAMPVRGGSVDTLRSFLNVRADTDFVLVVAWALACLRDRGLYGCDSK